MPLLFMWNSVEYTIDYMILWNILFTIAAAYCQETTKAYKSQKNKKQKQQKQKKQEAKKPRRQESQKPRKQQKPDKPKNSQ